MKPGCHRFRPQLVELAGGVIDDAERARLIEHLADCADCHALLARLEAGVGAWRASEPPAVTDLLRRSQIARAVAEPAARPRRAPFGLWALGASLAVAATLVFWPRPEAAVRLLHGALEVEGRLVADREALGFDAGPLELVAPEDAEIRLAGGTHAFLGPSTRATLTHTAGDRWHWQLAAGALRSAVEKLPEGGAYVIDTALASVTVTGTEFSVQLESDGATAVAVQAGVVTVVSRLGGETRQLRAGEAWHIAPPAPLTAEAPAPVSPALPPAAPARAATGEIRAQLESGQVAAARRLITSARAAARGNRATLAELAILEAQAFLAERQMQPAVEAYLRVVTDFPGMPQAEEALFAAAQLALDMPAAGQDGRSLMRRYLHDYPDGQFREEAQRILAHER